MKSTFLVLVLALAALGMPCFAGAVHLTGNVSADFLGGNSAPQIINTFTVGDQPLFWGFGWEVIIDHFGFGGDYLVSFYQDAGEHWWLDWYAPALFLSFHPLGGRSFLDPFLQVGIGSSGGVATRASTHACGHRSHAEPFPFPLPICGGRSRPQHRKPAPERQGGLHPVFIANTGDGHSELPARQVPGDAERGNLPRLVGPRMGKTGRPIPC